MAEILTYFFLLVPFCVVAGLVFYGYSHIFFFFFRYLKPLSNHRRKILQKFAYYRRLPLHQKNIFEKRVQRFISLKEFIPMEMDEVNQEMKVLIAASAVQLTFGLPEVQLADFDKIYVYPEKYYSKINRQYHSGEVNARGYISIAWDAFKKGYKNPSDAFNVGLHEMAHALILENISSDYELNVLDREAFINWKKAAAKEFERIRRGAKSYFRKYAFRDKEEFFPVCTEYFFERPKEFKEERPELYEALSKLLKQDPAGCT
jgi:hypothetical protein